MMKKFLALLMVLCLFAVCAVAEEAPVQGSIAAAAVTFELTESADVQNIVFDAPVIISGEDAVITFAGCVFNDDIILNSASGTRVILMPDCTVNGRLVFNSGVKESTLEAPFPKFLVFAPVEAVSEDGFGTVIALGDFEITFNGDAYTLADATMFIDNTNLDAGMVPYEGQEANIFVVAHWWENGVECTLVECEYDPEA